MAEQTATKLLQGSKALHRMQQEIGEFIELLIGYLNAGGLVIREKEEGFNLNHELLFPVGDQKHWVVGRYNGTFGLYFEFKIPDWGGHRQAYHSQDRPCPSAENVKLVREALEPLAKALGERYPEMKAQWQPLLDAADC